MKRGLILTIAGVLAVILLTFSAPVKTLAVGGGDNPQPVTLLNPLCTSGSANCQNGTVEGLLQSIVKWLFVIATPIAVGMILIGAFQMLLSGGNEDKFSTGKKTILYAVIGYAIILIGWGITSIIQSLLSQ